MEASTNASSGISAPFGDTHLLTREIQFLRAELQSNFQEKNWSQLSRSLEAVVRVGETGGQMELCLRAQSLRELMGSRSSGRTSAGARMEELFHELMFHLSHFQWVSQTSH